MTIKEAIDLLERHNSWRTGADIPMEEPRAITEAINLVINDYKKKEESNENSEG